GPSEVYGLTVVERPPAKDFVDVIFFGREALFHAQSDLSTDVTTSWTTLDTPGQNWVLSTAAAIAASENLALYAYAPAAAAQFSGILRRERSGGWSDWQEIPLTTGDVVALAATSTANGVEHLAVATATETLYGARAVDGTWSEWTALEGVFASAD